MVNIIFIRQQYLNFRVFNEVRQNHRLPNQTSSDVYDKFFHYSIAAEWCGESRDRPTAEQGLSTEDCLWEKIKVSISGSGKSHKNDIFDGVYWRTDRPGPPTGVHQDSRSGIQERPTTYKSQRLFPEITIEWVNETEKWTISATVGSTKMVRFTSDEKVLVPSRVEHWKYIDDNGIEHDSDLMVSAGAPGTTRQESTTLPNPTSESATSDIPITPVPQKEPEKWGFVSSLHAVGPNETNEVIIDAPCEHIGMGYLALSSEKIITYQDFTGREFESEYFSVTSLSNKTGDQLAPPVSMKYSGDNDYAWGFAAFWWCEEEQRR